MREVDRIRRERLHSQQLSRPSRQPCPPIITPKFHVIPLPLFDGERSIFTLPVQHPFAPRLHFRRVSRGPILCQVIQEPLAVHLNAFAQ
jgi:hypothetical protein